MSQIMNKTENLQMNMHVFRERYSQAVVDVAFVVLRCGLMLRGYQWIMQMRKLSKRSSRKTFCPCFIRLDASLLYHELPYTFMKHTKSPCTG